MAANWSAILGSVRVGVAVGGGEDGQLDVGEFEAEDVGHDQDGVLGAAILGHGDICTDYAFVNRGFYILDTSMCVLSPVMVLISPCGVPSCLTPMAQHFCAGWDAMLELLCMLGVSKKKQLLRTDCGVCLIR